MCNNFSGQHLQVIGKGVFSLPGLLRLTIKITYQLTKCFAQLEGNTQVFYEPFEGLVFLCYHANMKLHLIPCMFGTEVHHQLHGLSLSWPSILYMDMDIFPLRLRDQSSCCGVTTLQFANIWFPHPLEFLCGHMEPNFFWVASERWT